MSTETVYVGGCLCGAVRYEARGESQPQGYCFCRDCRKASGSAFIPFLTFPAGSVRFSGATKHHFSKSIRGSDAVRNRCPSCGALIFGGVVGEATEHTIYAGSLDDPTLFHPTIAVFLRDKPDWLLIPEGLVTFETLPGQ